MHLFQKVALAVLLLVLFLPSTIYAATPGPLEAGAARIDITPSTNAIPKPYTSILDHIYARAIYLQNGRDRAVLLNADVGAISSEIADKASNEISRDLNVPASNILISATHNHSAIFGGP